MIVNLSLPWKQAVHGMPFGVPVLASIVAVGTPQVVRRERVDPDHVYRVTYDSSGETAGQKFPLIRVDRYLEIMERSTWG